jgi:DNA-binding response OmpR family regulator
MANILVVEDDIDIAKGIGEYVEILGHELDFAYTGKQALQMINDYDYDLILLDINLPQVSGYDICQSLLEEGLACLPVIMMSANQSEQDVLKGFQSGAWDYLKKPFSYAELNARITVALSRISSKKSSYIQVKEYSLDTKAKTLSHNNGPHVQLHTLGFTLVKLLMENSPKPVATSQLVDKLWPDDLPQSNPLRANIYALRKQLKNTFHKELVHNIKGIGYKFDAEI